MSPQFRFEFQENLNVLCNHVAKATDEQHDNPHHQIDHASLVEFSRIHQRIDVEIGKTVKHVVEETAEP